MMAFVKHISEPRFETAVLTLFVLLASLSSLPAYSSETDPFTARALGLTADISYQVDKEINSRIVEAVEQTNLTMAYFNQKSCRSDMLYSGLKKQLKRIFFGKVEGWLSGNPNIPQVNVPLARSIYSDLRFRNAPPIFLPKMGVGPTVNIFGLAIGTDKFGHFFDEGYAQYRVLKNTGNTKRAIQKGINTEKGLFGLTTTGVYSYADLVANYHGMLFWKDMLEANLPESYLSCVVSNAQGAVAKYVIKRSFRVADYVDAAWDESINCSYFREGSFRDRVLAQINDLGLSCPVVHQQCPKLRDKYSGKLKALLSPQCR